MIGRNRRSPGVHIKGLGAQSKHGAMKNCIVMHGKVAGVQGHRDRVVIVAGSSPETVGWAYFRCPLSIKVLAMYINVYW
jgi:hypothetical protein